MDALRAQARGEGPSHANLILQQALEGWKAGIASTFASQRGLNPGLAARQVLQQQAAAAQAIAGEAAKARIEEIDKARERLADVLIKFRKADKV